MRPITRTCLARAGVDSLHAAFLAKEMCVFRTECAGTIMGPTHLEGLVPTKAGNRQRAQHGVLQVCVTMTAVPDSDLTGIPDTPDSYQSLTSCGGTKYCCSDTSSCCSKPNLVFDIGIPSVVNNYGSSQTISTFADQPTTGQKTIITAAATGTDSIASSGTLAVVTTTDSNGHTITTTPQATSTSASSQATSTTSHKSLIIGVAAGVIVLLVLAVITGVLLCCALKKRRAKEAPPINLIDMNTPMQPQQANNGSNVHLVQKPGIAHGAYGPEKQAWDPVPAYTPPHWQQQPVDGRGQSLIELQSPAVQQRPHGGPVYEMH
jgi:hypothetical protein